MPKSPLSLQEQILNKVGILDSITTSAPFTSLSGDKPKLVVMGHSVGAYMALQTLRLRPQKVDKVFLLFPTLSHISKGSTFSRASAVITSLPGAARLAALIVFLMRFIFPIPLLAIFVRLVYALPGTSLSTTLAKFLNPKSVESFTYLAKHEFRDIGALDVDTLTKYAKRVTAYYAVEDGWVPNFAREEAMRIITESGGDAHLCNEGFPHSFSLGTIPPFLLSTWLMASAWTADGEKDCVVDFDSVPSCCNVSRYSKVPLLRYHEGGRMD